MSDKIKITLPDGNVQEKPKGISGAEIAAGISEGLARMALAVQVNGEVWDLSRKIEDDASISILTWRDEGGKMAFWHSSAHLLAEALEAEFPGIKFGIGPPIENGFYYDVDLGGRHFSDEDFEKIEKKMLELAKQANAYSRMPISKKDAIDYFKEKGDEYKLELLEDLQDGDITFYQQGNFTDLCRGPHIPDTSPIKAVKLLNIAGAYWRGDEKRKQLTRVYAITFPKQKELTEYLENLERAKENDHRKLGKELGLFAFSQKVGLGLPLWLPKGARLREKLEQFLKKAQVKAGYDPVVTPHIGGKELYVTSGHYEKYGKDSFQPINTPAEGEEFLLKPMNCPHHCEIYKSRPRSYKDLPLRLAEFGTVYRYEQHGELHGLTRVRGFTQDDAHIFCQPDQVKEEFKKVIDLTIYILQSLGFENYEAQVSVRDPNDPDKYIGDPDLWDKAEKSIKEAAEEKGLEFYVQEDEAAFYGPKLDFMVRDVMNRKWQLGTIQVDYSLPERFQLEYIGTDNQPHRPVMIHRAPFGSMERFVALLIENCGGNFPFWLAPEQVIVLPISEKFHDYSNEVLELLKEKGFEVSADERDEKIGRKIRDAEVGKVPIMLIVGEKERESKSVSIRKHTQGDMGTMELNELLVFLGNEEDASLKSQQKEN